MKRIGALAVMVVLVVVTSAWAKFPPLISLSSVKAADGNPGCVDGSGTFSLGSPAQKLVMIEMVVEDTATNKEVSRTIATVPKDTTQWGSISSKLASGKYRVYAEMFTTDQDGKNPQKVKSNEMTWNQ